MAFEILPVVEHTPVLAGVCATDPFMMPRLFLKELAELGYAGIQNFPTVGLIEGDLRATLEETGMGYDKEVECVALAREMDLLTTPYAFNPTESEAMAKPGADIVVAHMGCTSGGTIGAKSVKTLERCVELVRAIVEAAKKVRKDVLCLCHGGPIAMPDDALFVIVRVEGLDGFYGASSTERLPNEIAIRAQFQEFKRIRLPKIRTASKPAAR
jgi:predicted TIM-barrel enzyme